MTIVQLGPMHVIDKSSMFTWEQYWIAFFVYIRRIPFIKTWIQLVSDHLAHSAEYWNANILIVFAFIHNTPIGANNYKYFPSSCGIISRTRVGFEPSFGRVHRWVNEPYVGVTSPAACNNLFICISCIICVYYPTKKYIYLFICPTKSKATACIL